MYSVGQSLGNYHAVYDSNQNVIGWENNDGSYMTNQQYVYFMRSHGDSAYTGLIPHGGIEQFNDNGTIKGYFIP
jgi:hypothetical protein